VSDGMKVVVCYTITSAGNGKKTCFLLKHWPTCLLPVPPWLPPVASRVWCAGRVWVCLSDSSGVPNAAMGSAALNLLSSCHNRRFVCHLRCLHAAWTPREVTVAADSSLHGLCQLQHTASITQQPFIT
jgi:hypothetical protein